MNAVERSGSEREFVIRDAAEARRRLERLQGMEPVAVNDSAFAGIMDAGQLRSIASDIYMKLQPALNEHDGRTLHFVKSGLKKTRSHSADSRTMRIIPSLPELFAKAVPLYTDRPREGKGAKAKTWHTYAVKAMIDGQETYIRLTAWESNTGELHLDYHDANFSNTKGDPRPTAVRETNPPRDGLDRLSKDTIHHWMEIVKATPDIQTEQYQQSAHGYVDLYKATPVHRAAAVIRATKNADQSLMPHELAHIILADMRDYVATGKADPQTIKQYVQLSQWAGDLNIVENVEKVARGMEQYLREGRAPSVQLVRAFGLFSNWMAKIYPDIRQYVGQDLDRNVRGVYDRWFASERQIREADIYYKGLKGKAFVNLLDDEEEKKKLEERREHNRARIRARHAREMAAVYLDAKGNQATIMERARREVDAQPVYHALTAAGGTGLDRATAVAMVGEQAVLDIIDRHGDIFAASEKAIAPVKALDKAGYWEKDKLGLFLRELAAAEPLDEAVRKHGPHARRKRFYEAMEAISRAGGMDMALALETAGQEVVDAIVEAQGEGLFRPAGHEAIEALARNTGFSSGDEMLLAMAKAPARDQSVEQAAERTTRETEKESRKWATEAVDVFADSALHHPDEDIDADTIDITRQAIHRAMKADEKRRRQYIERRVIADRARQKVESLDLRQAKNYWKWAEAERRFAQRAAEAAAAGDKSDALAALDKQQYYHALVTESFRIRKAHQDFVRKYAYRMANSELGTVAYPYRETVKDILSYWEIIKSRSFQPDNSDPQRLTLPKESDRLQNAKGEAIDEDLDAFNPPLEKLIEPWILNKRKPDNYAGLNDLTVVQMRQIDNAVQLLIDRGRGELNALKSDQAATREELKRKVMTVMKTLPDHAKSDPRTWWSRRKKGAESYFVSNLLIDRIAAEADGNPMLRGGEMGLVQRLVAGIRGREVEQMEMLEKFQNESKADFEVVDGMAKRLKKVFGASFFSVDGVEMAEGMKNKKGVPTFDADILLSIFYNMGNRGNRYALQEGHGFSDKDLDRLASLATAKEWEAIQNIGQRLDRFHPLMDEVYFRQTNKHMSKVEPTPFVVTTADGVLLHLRGWYYPLVYDPGLSDRAAAQAEMEDFKSSMRAIHTPTKSVDGFTHGRAVDEDGNPVVARPQLLKSSVLVSHLTHATRWITHAEALYEFRQLTMDPEFKEMFVQKLGEEKYRYIREWTNRLARPDKGKSGSWNNAFRTLRSMSTMASLGLNIRSALRQNESFGIAADTMTNASRDKSSGWWWMLQGFKKMGVGGFLGGWVKYQSEATKEMHEKSSEARMRSKDVNKEIRDLSGKTDPTKRDWQIGRFRLSRDIFFHFTKAMDEGVAGVVWWGSYLQARDGHAGFETEGLSKEQIEEKAVLYADTVLRTQQSPFQADYTRLQADNGPISLFTQFMGGVTPYLSHTYGMGQEWRRGRKSTYAMTRHLVYTYAIPVFVRVVLAKMLMRGLFGGDDDDDESLAKQFAWEMASNLTAPLPLVRDFVGVLQYGERSATIPSISTPGRSAAMVKRGMVKAIEEGDIEAASADFGRALAVFIPLYTPFRQARQAGEAVGVFEEED